MPPSVHVPNGCSGLAGDGTQAGIWIFGTNVILRPFPGQEHRKVQSIDSFVDGVLVEGFTIRRFIGLNFAVVRAKDAEIRDNTSTDSASYGVLRMGSECTLITRNKVNSSDLEFISICIGDQSGVSAT